jgi:hypothetical protein
MEFTISNILLLDDVRKLMTKKVSLSLPLEKVDNDFVGFVESNVKKYPGNTELYIHVNDEETGYAVRLRSQVHKMELNDEFIQFLQGSEVVKYMIEKV